LGGWKSINLKEADSRYMFVSLLTVLDTGNNTYFDYKYWMI